MNETISTSIVNINLCLALSIPIPHLLSCYIINEFMNVILKSIFVERFEMYIQYIVDYSLSIMMRTLP